MILPFASAGIQDPGNRSPYGTRSPSLGSISFWVLAVLINVLYAACCVAPDLYLVLPLLVGWLVIGVPTIGGLGAAWAARATGEDGALARVPHRAWLAVIALTVMPLVTIWTFWPLRLAFLTSRPALEVLADRVAAGQPPTFPRRAGLFTLNGWAVDLPTGNVGLMIDPNPNGPTGFVRIGGRTPIERRFNPIGGDDLEVALGSGCWYHEED